MHPFDVAVIGAGLAGLESSRLLAARGLRVLLIDRKDSIAAPVQTTGIFVRKTWEDFDLPDEQMGAPIRDVILYSPARRPLRLTADQDEFRLGRMPWIYLQLLERCCRAGVTWMPSSRLVSCEQRERGSRIVIARRRRPQTFDVRFVIGADGARSAVARSLGLDRNRELLVGIEEIVAARSDEPPALHCFLDPRLAPGYIAWVVSDREEAHVGVAGYANRFRPAESLQYFRESLRGRFDLGKTVERRGGLIPVGGVLRRIGCVRGLLAGDAAGAVSPLTAGGLDGAIRLSRFAAEVAAAYLESGDPRILAHYSGKRFRARFIARRWMRRLMSAMATPLAAEIACAILRTPLLRALASHVFFARGSFPDVRLKGSIAFRTA